MQSVEYMFWDIVGISFTQHHKVKLACLSAKCPKGRFLQNSSRTFDLLIYR